MVEAMALGRHAIGTDVSSLAVFVSQVKTTLLNDNEINVLELWANRLFSHINIHRPSFISREYADTGYYRHLENRVTWRLRKGIEQALASAVQLDSPTLQAFARCVVLKTAQWALDGRKRLPDIEEFRESLLRSAKEMLGGARQLQTTVNKNPGKLSSVYCLNKSASDVGNCPEIARRLKAKLVLTSPPYPGIHVLYHRWQVDGRKETPAPFWIADCQDGSGAAYYSMGDRKAVDLRGYFKQIQAALGAVAQLCDQSTTVVQVVAFSKPDLQLTRYLEANNAVGLQEMRLPILATGTDGRLWRPVPNRKWHANQLGPTAASHEVVLFHKLSPQIKVRSPLGLV